MLLYVLRVESYIQVFECLSEWTFFALKEPYLWFIISKYGGKSSRKKYYLYICLHQRSYSGRELWDKCFCGQRGVVRRWHPGILSATLNHLIAGNRYRGSLAPTIHRRPAPEINTGLPVNSKSFFTAQPTTREPRNADGPLPDTRRYFYFLLALKCRNGCGSLWPTPMTIPTNSISDVIFWLICFV